MPRMLCDIITDMVASTPDLEIVGDVPTRDALPQLVDQTDAEVVVMGLKSPEPPVQFEPLFEAHPHVRVLGLAHDGRGAFLYQLRPQRSRLGELSAAGLVRALRAPGP